MGEQRGWLFRIGDVGLTCAGYEVAVTRGTETVKGTVRIVRDCDNPTTEVVGITGLCADCAVIFRRDPTEVAS